MLESRPYRKEVSAGYRLTTNNRMELLGVITALEMLRNEGSEVVVHSDSQYVVNAVKKGWVFSWEAKRFKDRKNADLWRRFLKVYRRHKVEFEWLKGHAGHPENELCDRMAVAAAGNKAAWKEDEGYNAAEDALM